MTMILKKNLIGTLLGLSFCVFLLLPNQVVAVDGLVTCTAGNTCGTCELVQMIERIIDFIITIMLVVATIIFAYAGFLMVTSGGNQSQIEKGKSFFINTLIGLILMLCAWLIVDTIMKSLVAYDGAWGETRFGPWHGLSCTVQEELGDGETITSGSSWDNVAPVYPIEDGLVDTNYSQSDIINNPYWYRGYTRSYDAFGDVCKSQPIEGGADTAAECDALRLAAIAGVSIDDYYFEQECVASEAVVIPIWANAPFCSAAPGTENTAADGAFSYQSGISAQRPHASAALESMLSCMEDRVPANVGQISSISDGWIVNGSKTWVECRAGQCQHTANSFHYGHTGGCGDRSFAVDFGDEGNEEVLCNTARACGVVQMCSVHNNAGGGGGKHVHLEIPISC